MGWRLRRSIKIAPGVRLNVSGSGVGMSVGGKGMRVGIGPRGVYTSVGIPGTGLYRIDYLRERKQAGQTPVTNPPVASGEAERHEQISQPQEKKAEQPTGLFVIPNLLIWSAVGLVFVAYFTSSSLAIGAGVASAVSLFIGTVLYVRARRHPRWLAWMAAEQARRLAEEALERAKRIASTDPRQAAELLEKAAAGVGLDRAKIREAKIRAGMIYHDLGEHERAVQYLGEFDLSSIPYLQLIYANSLYTLRRFDETISVLQDSQFVHTAEDKELTQEEIQAITMLGASFAEKSDHATAIEVYERLTRRRKMDEHMALLRYGYARSLEAVGNLKAAIRELRKVVAFDAGLNDASQRLENLVLGKKIPEAPEEDAI